jgi:gamma-glutamyltranspeptidase/glutathione hydrolase
MNWTLHRRTFLGSLGSWAAAANLARLDSAGAAPPQAADKAVHSATGSTVAVTSTSREATEAALGALQKGGSAADAYLAAALTQTVVEPGLTSLGGALGVTYFHAATGETAAVTGRLGPAAAEPYDFNRHDHVTQTGRAMPVPGFLAGVQAAHAKFGVLPWAQLFEPAIRSARAGFALPAFIVAAARKHAARFAEGQALWMKDGRFLEAGATLIQEKLGQILQSVAKDGPAAFYQGPFAENYVQRSQQDGGKLALSDLARWRELVSTTTAEPEGDYRGYQVWAPRAGLLTYALHLNEALDLKSSGPARAGPESVFRQCRVMEEVFLATKTYTPQTHAQFVSREYARQRADFVLNSPLRKVTLDALFNTCFLVVRDAQGNCAWGTHSINTPTAFGAGIIVDGVYAAYALNKAHVHGTGATAPGITTSYALYKAGRPRIICGSPGFGFVHGPYQFGTSVVEWGVSPARAIADPRFSVPLPDGRVLFEQHYDDAVFAMLEKRGIKHVRGRASEATGLVGALVVADDGTLHVAQDPRRDGFAMAFLPWSYSYTICARQNTRKDYNQTGRRD